MDRLMFAHSRVRVDYQDGSSVGTCSLHCAALELALSIDKTPATIWVGDFHSRELIDAEHAYWVLGGEKPGVMTARAKWAFAKRGAAEQFVADHGGVLVSFGDAMRGAYEDMHQDTLRIRHKRRMKRQQAASH